VSKLDAWGLLYIIHTNSVPKHKGKSKTCAAILNAQGADQQKDTPI